MPSSLTSIIGNDTLLIRQLGKYVSAPEVCGFPLDFSLFPGPVISHGPVDWLQPMHQGLLPPPFRHLIQTHHPVFVPNAGVWTVMETDGTQKHHSSLSVLLALHPLRILFTASYSWDGASNPQTSVPSLGEGLNKEC